MTTIKDHVKTLREYNKWRRGRGRKYSAPGIPFSSTDIGYAIDRAVKVLSVLPTDSDFEALRNADVKLPKRVVRKIERLAYFMKGYDEQTQ